MRHTVLSLLALTAAAAAAPKIARADSSLIVEGFAGWQDLRFSRGGLGGAVSGREGTAIVGGDVMARLEGLGVGLAVDKTVSGSGGQPWAGSIVAGLLLDLLPSLRLEGLGEVGRRASTFGDMFDSPGSTFLGLRPGVSFRLLPSPLRVGVTGLVRWPTSNGDIGSPDYGFVGRVGFELP